MSRNANSRFALNPTNIDIQRSKFSMDHTVTFSGNVGDLIPFDVQEVLPGDTFQYNTSKLLRLQTLIAPIMSNLFLDTYYFFVPSRLCWSHWKQFNGENTESKWIPTTTYQVPVITAPANTGWEVGTIADYLGVPINVPNIEVNALPFRAYGLICNEWFRDENNTDYLDIPLGDATVAGVNSGNFITDVAKGGKPFKAAKFHDYFTSALPSPQKGPEVSLGLTGDIPVFGNGYNLGITDGTGLKGFSKISTGSELTYNSGAFGKKSPATTGGSGTDFGGSGSLGLGVATMEQLGANPEYSGLVANLSDASLITINSLRLAFATQRMYERDARGGKN